MKALVTAFLAVALAVTATITLASAWPGSRERIDFFLIVVVYYAVTRSRTRGILMGAFGGLVQDVFTSHFLGFHAFVKTGVAYLIGGMGAKFMLNQPFPQVLALLLATVLDAGLAALLSFMAGLPVLVEPGEVGTRMLINSVVGLLAYRLVQRYPVEAWATRR